MRDAGVVKQHVRRQILDRRCDGVAKRRTRFEPERRQTSEDRRVVVLNPGRHAQEARLEIPDERDERFAALVDRFLDMSRTTLNVTGDLAAAVVVSRGEGARPAMAEVI